MVEGEELRRNLGNIAVGQLHARLAPLGLFAQGCSPRRFSAGSRAVIGRNGRDKVVQSPHPAPSEMFHRQLSSSAEPWMRNGDRLFLNRCSWTAGTQGVRQMRACGMLRYLQKSRGSSGRLCDRDERKHMGEC